MYAKISFISFFLALVCFIPMFYQGASTSDFQTHVGPAMVAMLAFAILSIVTAIVSLAMKEANKVLPTISLSVASFSVYMFIVIVTILSETKSPVRVEKGAFTNYGIFDIPSKIVDSTRTDRFYELRYLKNNTDSIPALKGLYFGFNYVISGAPEFEYASITKVIRYPEPGLKRNSKIVPADTSSLSVPLNRLRYSGFRFDHDYELVPGKWEFEMSYKGVRLFSKVFTVYIKR